MDDPALPSEARYGLLPLEVDSAMPAVGRRGCVRDAALSERRLGSIASGPTACGPTTSDTVPSADASHHS
jgi:hypothetical protein